ncbi:hypothetical protein EVJ50_02170 [Synechococcus sp. RSCCF101]|uniref:hypothetical protein n=1 Tax=Synechococcus sp. RSCCF101 TaxID=2511069 RepID=UPI001246A493|nr:hypothetical protein [Synechococcus sp. RSCCF101]QEY31231.1 hypothetical protein EVJ50_02170 [Synechococcus sp. RSCCF101]
MDIERPGRAPLTEDQMTVLNHFRSQVEAILSDGRVDAAELQTLVQRFRAHRDISSELMDVLGELWPGDLDLIKTDWD